MVTRRRSRLMAATLVVLGGASLGVGGFRVLVDHGACDQREVTSVTFSRCLELRRQARFGPFWALGADRDLDRIVEEILAEGTYPPPYSGPIPVQIDPGPPTQAPR